MAGLGISTDDISQIITDQARTVSYTAVTRTSDPITGDESLAFGTPANKTWIFLKRQQRFLIDKEGIFEQGDAYLLIPITDTPSRKDRVTIDGETYEMFTVIKRVVFGTALNWFVVLYKVSGAQA